MKGRGLVNTLINKLPFELHIPGYNYCGPGTKLESRLARGDKGVNPLDEYCKYHDIAYTNSNNLTDRHKADIILMKKAKSRQNSSDTSFGEKVASSLVYNIMKAKVKSGAGLKQNLRTIVSHARKHVRKTKPYTNKKAIKIAYAAAKKLVHKKPFVKIPRVIPVPKSGGFLPLIPILAGLSAVGSIAGGAAGIAKTINDYKSARKQIAEQKRHNEKMEAIAIGKGLYLKPYKTGLGLYLNGKKKKTPV